MQQDSRESSGEYRNRGVVVVDGNSVLYSARPLSPVPARKLSSSDEPGRSCQNTPELACAPLTYSQTPAQL